MSDNTILNTMSGGDTIASDDIAGVKHQLVKIEYGAADSATPVSPTNPLPVLGTGPFDVQTSLIRPADTTAYAIGDAMSDSTSAPASGGFTLASVARVSGGGILLTDLIIVSSFVGNLQGILYLFNQAVTANNDNAAFALSDADSLNLVAGIPFYLTAEPSNSWQHLQNLAITALCSGSADLRFLIKLTAAYTPGNAERISVRAKGLRLN